MPSDKFEKYNEAWAEKITASLDRDNSVWNLPTAMRAVSPLMDISGVYCVIGKNGWMYIANRTVQFVLMGMPWRETRIPILSKKLFSDCLKMPPGRQWE
jgi:hypothetical protein